MSYAVWNPAPVLLEHLEKEPPFALFHYTNQSGLLGILRTHELWVSNIHFLNDHREFHYGMNVITNCIVRKRNAAGPATQHFFDQMLHQMGTLDPSSSRYVASWSAAVDDLSQWRAYSQGGTGYSISIQGSVLRALANAQRFVFAPCVYELDEQARMVDTLVDVSLLEMIDDEERGVKYERAAPGDNLLIRALRFSPLMKHPAFRGEKEWRLVFDFPGGQTHPTFALREGRSTLIPYLRFKLKLESAEANIPIAFYEIMVGPCADANLAREAAFLALLAHAKGNKGELRVRSSTVPYRNW